MVFDSLDFACYSARTACGCHTVSLSDPGVENDRQLQRLNYLLTVATLAQRRRGPNGTFYPLPSATGKEPI